MTRHTVKQGDSVIKLADKNGFFPDTIWDHADNAELKKLRKDMNVLLPGDVVVIPDLREKIEKVETEKRHTFRRKGMPAVYRVQLFLQDEPRAKEAFKLEIDVAGAEDVVYEGKTDADGVLSTTVPARAKTARLYLGEDPEPFEIQFGYLDPEDALSGLRQRLEQLGFSCDGDQGNEIGLGTTMALLRFQDRFDLDPSGEADDATVKKLDSFYAKVDEFPERTEP